MDFNYPTTAEQWWQLLKRYKQALRCMVATYHSTFHASKKATISAPGAEAACEEVRRQIVKENRGLLPVTAFDKALEARDGPALDRPLQKNKQETEDQTEI
jgi:hypothetical protein